MRFLAASLASFALVLGAASGACAQADAAAAKPASPPMWRVSDADSEVFLLGTFHILPPGLQWRTPALEAALAAADTYWFEAETDTPAANQKTVQVLMTQGFNPQGRTLTQILGADDAAILTRVAGDLGLPMSAVDPMRPWQAFLTLSVKFIVSQGFNPASGVDATLLSEGRIKGRSLKFFETIEEQLGFFTSLPASVEKNLLVFTLRDWDAQAEEFDTLFEAWRTGDTDMIDEIMNQPMRESAREVYAALVTKRNAAWAEDISTMMRGSGKTLVAVGAGHLAGADSLPKLLEAKGFKVERYGVDTAALAPANDNDPIGDVLQDIEDASNGD